jgi:hypothetical protein
MPASSRALLVVAALSQGGVARLRLLYRVLDRAAALLGGLLGSRYGRSLVVRGASATRQAISASLKLLVELPGIAAVDVFLNVHGRERTLTLADGEVSLEDLAVAVRALGEPARKLRLLYSTACHAAHHAPTLRAAGFRTCLGARRINATGAVETPLFLALWARGLPAGRALRLADHPAARIPADAVARRVLRLVGEQGRVDSAKELCGDGTITIATDPSGPSAGAGG